MRRSFRGNLFRSGLVILSATVSTVVIGEGVAFSQTPASQQSVVPQSIQNAPAGSNPSSGLRVVPQSVQIGEFVSGILDRFDPVLNQRYISSYRFSGRSGQPVQVLLLGSRDRRKVNNLSMQPYLVLYGPDNRIIARTGAEPNTIAAYIRLRLPQDGEYTAVIAGVEPQKSGRYSFAVQNIEPRLAENLKGVVISENIGSVPAVSQQTGSTPATSARP